MINPNDQNDDQHESQNRQKRNRNGDMIPEEERMKGLSSAFGWFAVIIIPFVYFIGSAFLLGIAGVDPESLMGEGRDPGLGGTSSTTILLLTAAGQIFFLLLPAIFLARRHPLGPLRVLRLRRPPTFWLAMVPIGIIGCLLLASSWNTVQNEVIVPLLSQDMQDLFFKQQQQTGRMIESLLSSSTPLALIISLFTLGLIIPIAEEGLFRGLIQRSFEETMRPIWAIGISAIFFSFIHSQISNAVPILILGIFFGYAAWSSRSILVPILAHILFNSFQAIASYVGLEWEILGPDTPLIAILRGSIGFVLLAGIVIAARRWRAENVPLVETEEASTRKEQKDDDSWKDLWDR